MSNWLALTCVDREFISGYVQIRVSKFGIRMLTAQEIRSQNYASIMT